jgi:hypothetical protein
MNVLSVAAAIPMVSGRHGNRAFASARQSRAIPLTDDPT